ncbi:MAG: carboxymuconolactone decarboxylase family protein [Gemmatimonadetes bacterium]|nr:carboxymuconolactone decarboxylase family protein [Gemmatimonadota bacterium]
MAYIDDSADSPAHLSLDHILRVSAVNPAALRAHRNFYRALVHAPGPLSRVRREMIGVAVSRMNGCHY